MLGCNPAMAHVTGLRGEKERAGSFNRRDGVTSAYQFAGELQHHFGTRAEAMKREDQHGGIVDGGRNVQQVVTIERGGEAVALGSFRLGNSLAHLPCCTMPGASCTYS